MRDTVRYEFKMKCCVLVLVVLLAVVGYSEAQWFVKGADIIGKLNKMKKEDRLVFLEQHLGGDDQFSIQMYNQLQLEKKKVDEKSDGGKARELICFDDGCCIELGDPGVHPIIKEQINC